MTNIPPNPPSGSRPVERDEWIAIFVAFATLGSIFFWAMSKTDDGFNLFSKPMLLQPTSETTVNPDVAAGESKLSSKLSLGTPQLNAPTGESRANLEGVFPRFEQLGASLTAPTPLTETVEKLEPNLSRVAKAKTDTEAKPSLAKSPKTANQETTPLFATFFAGLGIGEALSKSPTATPPEIDKSPIAPGFPPLAPPVATSTTDSSVGTAPETAKSPKLETPKTAESPEVNAPKITKSPKAETPKITESPTPTQTVGAAAASPETSPTGTIKFSDIPDGFWASSFIQPLAQRDIIVKVENDKFEPDKPVTRAEFATQIPKIFEDKSTRNSVNYQDVSSDFAAKSEIEIATKSGFLSGYPGNVFRPEQKLSRLEVLISLASGLNLEIPSNPDAVLSIYKDKEKIPDWAKGKVAAATAAGLVVIHPDVTNLNPNQSATRAEVAAMFYQALVELEKVEPVASEYVVKPKK